MATATAVRRFTFGEGAGRVYLPGDPFEPTGVAQEKALWNRGYLEQQPWTSEYDPYLPGLGEPVESSRPHNRRKKVANAGN